jgi:hypothetical protein
MLKRLFALRSTPLEPILRAVVDSGSTVMLTRVGTCVRISLSVEDEEIWSCTAMSAALAVDMAARWLGVAGRKPAKIRRVAHAANQEA